ncbi:lipoprotein [Mesoplasma lactucae]|uniref:Uncharacterized protein n=1 Tax=Mesoplasma lactucae ATCC 49193 TaxID=81460 RepID=A0A291IRF9_9MOLU|nr:lipoprotein [Mesoplasma lactucae]ATG97306.1 hypothetical protein CP520_00840 [Mesoplasma lactucae ATCC 49193]ATZ20244.1 hypothetical protein MLACT_v1c04230 [Mesoplasma lactucae ATCC 49193]MCL8216993.1 hypothetical protein [Mesoplasma lactucae ATCC 49193]
MRKFLTLLTAFSFTTTIVSPVVSCTKTTVSKTANLSYYDSFATTKFTSKEAQELGLTKIIDDQERIILNSSWLTTNYKDGQVVAYLNENQNEGGVALTISSTVYIPKNKKITFKVPNTNKAFAISFDKSLVGYSKTHVNAQVGTLVQSGLPAAKVELSYDIAHRLNLTDYDEKSNTYVPGLSLTNKKIQNFKNGDIAWGFISLANQDNTNFVFNTFSSRVDGSIAIIIQSDNYFDGTLTWRFKNSIGTGIRDLEIDILGLNGIRLQI